MVYPRYTEEEGSCVSRVLSKKEVVIGCVALDDVARDFYLASLFSGPAAVAVSTEFYK